MRICVIFLILVASCSNLFSGTAVSISGLYTTGVNSNWLMTSGAGAYVVSNSVVNSNGWVPNSSSSKWISYSPTTQLSVSSYTYSLAFNINGDGGSGAPISNYVSITLTWTSDDTSILYLNGKSTGYTESGWTTTKTVTLDSTNTNFTIGPNTLSFVVNNSGGGPSGLMVTSTSYKILPTAPVPEKGTWIISVLTFVIVFLYRFLDKRD